jgi:hypothetical protein
MTTYKGVYIPANAETGWGPLVNANWTLLADREEVIRKTSAESVTSSTTLQNDNELVYTMEASHTWAFKLVVTYEGIVTCGVTAGNFQYQWAQSASNGTALIVATNSYLLMKLLV